MTTLQSVQDFTSQKSIAIVGVSRKENKFGNAAFKELKKKDLKVYPVNPHMDVFQGEKCYPDIKSLPPDVTGIVITTNPFKTLDLIKAGEERGIKHFWIQQGAENKAVIEYANTSKSNIVFKECILMFSHPVGSFHRFHRFFVKVFGKYPK
ncbi:MAG: CoA-binding protein [Bacteroidetes bacterium]|nr:CoA-binding protein [Bacteroidota bacterium]